MKLYLERIVSARIMVKIYASNKYSMSIFQNILDVKKNISHQSLYYMHATEEKRDSKNSPGLFNTYKLTWSGSCFILWKKNKSLLSTIWMGVYNPL